MKHNRNSRMWMGVSLILVFSVLISACTAQSQALNEAETIAANRQYYVPKNDVEGRNYNWRLEISDDPSLILWCTYFPPTPGTKPITVPIIGKLTSGSKRPFPQFTGSGENTDAQSMYGSSGEFRYGFGPTGKQEYYDFYSDTFCTTMPLTYQAELTVIIQEKDPILMAASAQAKEAIQRGDYDAANQILKDAIEQIQGGK